jgi:putative FmdB family regulatory protein
MPTYEYKCGNGHTYLEVRGLTEDSKVSICEEDGCGLELKRVFTAPPINFKGTGYSTGNNTWR